ncbi:MAG TPA: C13 family peptidase [Caulobacteraceae bacterium]
MGAWRTIAGLMAAWMLAAPPTAASAKSPFADWAAVVIAGDWHAHSGGPTEAFDNARRDVAATLPSLGFDKDNIGQFSTRPQRYPDTKPARAGLEPIYETLSRLAQRAPGGCLVYYTSHGGPPGVVLDNDGEQMIVPPEVMAELVDQACPNRPTVVVISACFSGVFIPVMAKSDRMILTAARPDRSSFGCGEGDKYPFFDDCFLKSSGLARDFQALGTAVQSCVRAREIETGARPPSEPQLYIGAGLKPMLPLYIFPTAAAPPSKAP